MRTGIKLETSTGQLYTPYSKIVFVRSTGQNAFQVVLATGHRVYFSNRETFEKIKNYMLTKHAVVDDIPPPNGGGVR